MSPAPRVSRAAIDLLKRFEGFLPRAMALGDGRWIIGHGHTLTAREGAEVSPEDAEALAIFDLMAVGGALRDLVFAPLTQNQFDALCAFVFNIGLDSFQRSLVLRRLNEGSPLQAACALEMWRQGEVAGERMVIDALVRRRAAEKALFLTPADGRWPVAPSAVLRPLLDIEGPAKEPSSAPAPVSAVFEDGRLTLVRDAATPAPAARPSGALRVDAAALFSDEAAASATEPPPEPPAAPDGSDDDQLELELRDPVAGETSSSPTPSQAGPIADVVFEPEDADSGAKGDAMPSAADEPPAYPFRTPLIVETRRSRPGPAMAIILAVIGLAFFAGGVFWGLNAQPGGVESGITPQVVGWLAGVAGALMLALATFMLLQRLGRSSEVAARDDSAD